MKKSRYILYIAIPVLTGAFGLLGWNATQVYSFERKQLIETVEQCIAHAADSIQNYNGSLLSNYAKSLTDSNYDTKVAFAAGFTHNMSKVTIPFDDNPEFLNYPKPTGDTPPPIFTKKYFVANNIVYNPNKVMNTRQFDSVFRKELFRSDAVIPYSIKRARRFTSVSGDTILSSQFILDFTNPVIYNVVYTIPLRLIWWHMISYLLTTLITCLLLAGGTIYLYRSYLLQLQTSRFRESILGNITHELKTPLSSLQLIIDIATNSVVSNGVIAVQSKHIKYAATELKRMKLLVERMLSFSKMNKEQLVLDKQQISLDSVIKDALVIMDVRIQQSGTTIQYCTSQSTSLAADPVLLTNAIAAIIDNAIKYCIAKPKIIIQTNQSGQFCTIAIQDNGIGIPKQYRNKIFEPFFRVPSGNLYEVPGHGLGLSFVKQVVTMHGSEVYFTSNEHGTTFCLKLK